MSAGDLEACQQSLQAEMDDCLEFGHHVAFGEVCAGDFESTSSSPTSASRT